MRNQLSLAFFVSVWLNFEISAIMQARDIKFGMKISEYHTQKMFIFNLKHQSQSNWNTQAKEA